MSKKISNTAPPKKPKTQKVEARTLPDVATGVAKVKPPKKEKVVVKVGEDTRDTLEIKGLVVTAEKEIEDLKAELVALRGLLEKANLNLSTVQSHLNYKTWQADLWSEYKEKVANAPWYKLLWWRIKGGI